MTGAASSSAGMVAALGPTDSVAGNAIPSIAAIVLGVGVLVWHRWLSRTLLPLQWGDFWKDRPDGFRRFLIFFGFVAIGIGVTGVLITFD